MRHFLDARIANPELKEIMIIRLNGMLQFQDCITIIEKDSFGKQYLVENLLKCLDDRRTIIHTVKNFLRLSKGTGFKEIIYKGSKGPYELKPPGEDGLCLDLTYSE